MPFVEVDLLRDSEGDLVVASNGDLKLATEKETVEQDVLFRVLTGHLDFSPSPWIGADLGSLMGEPNSARTADLIKEHVHISLTQDGRIPNRVLLVDVIPIAIDKVQLLVIITDRIGNKESTSVISKTLALLPHSVGDESMLEVGT